MNEEIRKRDDSKFEVTDGEQWVAGPFEIHAEADRWVRSHRPQSKVVLPDDIRRTAKSIEVAYIQRTAMEDLTYLIGAAIAEERRRCLELTLSMNGRVIDAGGGLMRRPSFDYLAEKIRGGSTI
jgi:hypothetical protein